MSSIAYVTDEKMIEYHRLCGSRTMNFWRLSSKKEFKDFRKGDLLFFYTRSRHTRKKGFAGYAHFVTTNKLSLKQMWNRFGTENGYDSYEMLEEAIRKAAKDRSVPDKMNCLYLSDVVFFQSPVYPEEAGLSINENLESYCYLDQEDPQTTVRILRLAARNGIDLWSASQSFEPVDVFRQDEFRHQLSLIAYMTEKQGWSEKERSRARKLAAQKTKQEAWEYLRQSRTDCLKIAKDDIAIALPFVCQTKNRTLRIQELIGKITLYRLFLKENGYHGRLRFEIMSDADITDVEPLIEMINDEGL